MDMTELSRAGSLPDRPHSGSSPLPPVTPEDTGLPAAWLNQLLLRHLYVAGDTRLSWLAARLLLPLALLETLIGKFRMAKLIEPVDAGSFSAEGSFSLTDSGRARAAEAHAQCRYVGPAPVSLDSYRRSIAARASLESPRRDQLAEAFKDLALDDTTFEQLGVALASQRSFVVHGPPGSGRSSLVGRLAAISRGTVWLPHAVLAGDQVLRVFDPEVHQPAGASPDHGGQKLAIDWGTLGVTRTVDHRWVACHEPVITLNGAMSEGFRDGGRVLPDGSIDAPAHIKASPGTLIVDNVRGRASNRRLRRLEEATESGRCVVPVDGQRPIDLPLHLRIVTVESQSPARKGLDSRVARLSHAVSLGPLTLASYRRAAQFAAAKHGLNCDADALDRLMVLHGRSDGIPRLASIPDALFRRIADRSRWRDAPPVIDGNQIDWAWQEMFGCKANGGAG